VNVREPALMVLVGQLIDWSHGVGLPFQVSELKLQTLDRTPTPARPVVCVSTLMKL
jgi:hypothetical protein